MAVQSQLNGRTFFQRLLGLLQPPMEAAPTEAEIAQQMETLTAEFDDQVDSLVWGLTTTPQVITIGQFDGAMQDIIKKQQLAAATIGAGLDNAGVDVLALAQEQTTAQLAYFRAWMAELYAARELPSAAYMANRAKKYGKAAVGTQQRATVQSKGVPTLPFYKKDRTACHTGCLCDWVILPLGNGDYDCFWRLNEHGVNGAVEHCRTCLARAHVTRRPLKIRRGQIVDPEKYLAAELYA